MPFIKVVKATILQLLLISIVPGLCAAERPLLIVAAKKDQPVIAYSPEHTVLALASGATELWLPLMMTADDQFLIALAKDLNKTDIKERFPQKINEDGSFFPEDFTLAELKSLSRYAKTAPGGEKDQLTTRFDSLQERLILIEQLANHFATELSLYLELRGAKEKIAKTSQLLRQEEALALSKILLQSPDILPRQLLIQSDRPEILQQLDSTFKKYGQEIGLIQGIARPTPQPEDVLADQGKMADHEWLFTNTGMRLLTSYATALALPASQILEFFPPEKKQSPVNILGLAKKYGIKIYARDGLDGGPEKRETAGRLLLLAESGLVDGFYTNDFTAARSLLEKREAISEQKESLPAFFKELRFTPLPQTEKETETAPQLPPFEQDRPAEKKEERRKAPDEKSYL